MKTGGGSFLYHLENNQVYVGFVVHLNYANPYLNPFEEFQRFKTHPDIAELLEGGKRLTYGARAISEGGYQSVPKLVFPGGALIGCSAGFVNVPRIKGVHNAISSGMQAAEAAAEPLRRPRAGRAGALRGRLALLADRAGPLSRAQREAALVEIRHGARIVAGGLDMWAHQLMGRSLFGTLKHGKTDAASTEPAAKHKPIAYPKPDGVLTFDKTSSVFLSNTNHEEDQPSISR